MPTNKALQFVRQSLRTKSLGTTNRNCWQLSKLKQLLAWSSNTTTAYADVIAWDETCWPEQEGEREGESTGGGERRGPKRVVVDGRGMLFRAWDQNPFIHFDLDMSGSTGMA